MLQIFKLIDKEYLRWIQNKLDLAAWGFGMIWSLMDWEEDPTTAAGFTAFLIVSASKK